MADEFDLLLSSALAPTEREPDRRFVAKVQARIALEGRLAARERSMVADFAKQLVALMVVAASFWWLGRAATLAQSFAESPALGLAILLAGFIFLVGVLSSRQGGRTSLPTRF